MKVHYWAAIPVSIYGGDLSDALDTAIVELSKEEIRRILLLAQTVKEIKAKYIADNARMPTLGHCDEEIKNPGLVTDKTSYEKVGLLINHKSEIVRILAKHRLAGHSIYSPETLADLRTLITPWDGRSECDKLIVTDTDFYYTGIVRNTEAHWETDCIPLKDLLRIR
jgi:hypothetical protein